MINEFTLHIQLDVTPGVTDLVTSILTAIKNRETQAAPVEAPAAPAAPERKPRKKPEPAQEPDPAPEVTKESPANASDDMPQDIADPTEEDVRAAMHKTRQRIEGEDYKESTDSEGYKKYHTALTKLFKSISKKLSGQEKPSALAPEFRKSFILACDSITTADDGTLKTA